MSTPSHKQRLRIISIRLTDGTTTGAGVDVHAHGGKVISAPPQRTDAPRPTMRSMNSSQDSRAGRGFQLNTGTAQVVAVILKVHWVELVRADSRNIEGGLTTALEAN